MWLISYLEGVVYHGTLVLKVCQPNISSILQPAQKCKLLLEPSVFSSALASIYVQSGSQLLLFRLCTPYHIFFSAYIKPAFQSTNGQTLQSKGQSLCAKLVCSTHSNKSVPRCDPCGRRRFTRMLYDCQTQVRRDDYRLQQPEAAHLTCQNQMEWESESKDLHPKCA